MLKRISVRQLTVGMHLKKFCGSWMDHPFWRSGFVITDPKDIKAVLDSPIKEVWIDISKGLDVAQDEALVSQAQTGARAEVPAWKAAWKDKPVVRGETPAWKAAWNDKPGMAGDSPARPSRPSGSAETPAWKAAWNDKPGVAGDSPARPSGPSGSGETPAWKAAWNDKPGVAGDSPARPSGPSGSGETPAWKAAWSDKPGVTGDNPARPSGPSGSGETPAWKAAWSDKPGVTGDNPARPSGPSGSGETPAWKAAWSDKPGVAGDNPARPSGPSGKGETPAWKGKPLVRDDSAAWEARAGTQLKAQPIELAARPRETAPTSMDIEIQRASKICAQSKVAVVSMFREARMGKAVNLESVQLLVEEISDSIVRNPGALISLARLKTADDYTYLHSVAVCALMVALARQLRLDEEQTRAAGVAGLLHDLGKAMIPMEILNKPGKLTDAEFDIVKGHPVEGHKLLLGGSDVGDVALDVCLHHHEKVDGSGYPKGLKVDEISLVAKMGAVCDVYDAVTSNRPYKAGWDPAESLRKMAEWKGHFDPKVFQAFVKSMGIYPVGSLVRLTSGRLAVVTEQTGASLINPKVKVFFSTKSNMRIVPEIIDLSRPGCVEKIVGREDPDEWRFPDLNELWTGLTQAPG
jgi:HD-GYP domain-containing protein (c-di-GMP phosphodiesterase class II)